MNVNLVRTIKLHLADQTSDELRRMLEERDVNRYSEEAFGAAQEILDERARGLATEPPPKPPAADPTTAQLAAADDALLRRQVRLIGTYYYVLGVLWLLFGLLLIYAHGDHGPYTAAVVGPAVFFWLLGWSLRRFSPLARTLAILFGILHLPAIPIGTVVGLYSFDKLTRADHLFGGKRHPGEPEPG